MAPDLPSLRLHRERIHVDLQIRPSRLKGALQRYSPFRRD